MDPFVGPEHLLLAALATESVILDRTFEELELNRGLTETAIRWKWDQTVREGNWASSSSGAPPPAPPGYQTCEACGTIAPESVARGGCPTCGWLVWIPLDRMCDEKRLALRSMTGSLLHWARYGLPSPGELADRLTEAMPQVFAANALIVWDVSNPASPVPVARKPAVVVVGYVRASTVPATPVRVARKFRRLVASVATDKESSQIRRDFDATILFHKLRLGFDLVIQVVQPSDTPPSVITAAQEYLAFVVRWLSEREPGETARERGEREER
jgi:hypothetical protein